MMYFVLEYLDPKVRKVFIIVLLLVIVIIIFIIAIIIGRGGCIKIKCFLIIFPQLDLDFH